jgi:hypothetical protein
MVLVTESSFCSDALFYVIEQILGLKLPWNSVLLQKLIVIQLVKKFPRLLLNSNVYYRIRKCLAEDSSTRQLNSVHMPANYFLRNNIHFSIILPSVPC